MKNLVLTEVEKPTPKDNEVLIKIKATSVTTSDVLIRGLNASPFAKIHGTTYIRFWKTKKSYFRNGYIRCYGK